MILLLEPHDAAAAGDAPNTVVDAAAGVRWRLADTAPPEVLLAREVVLDPTTEWLMRHDRVDFQPGGVAYRHTHPGPGIRLLVAGTITIDSEGEQTTYAPGEAWFERGPDPVLAMTSATEPSAFVRVLVLPVACAGQRTIRYVHTADAARPKLSQATILSEQPVRR